MMMTVQILINGRVVIARSCRNVSSTPAGAGIAIYKIDDGRSLQHKRSDGAVALAIRMLEGVVNIDE